jgi:hypothetical protein
VTKRREKLKNKENNNSEIKKGRKFKMFEMRM